MQLILEEGIDFSLEIPVFRCAKCRYAHFEQDKTEMLRQGEWRPTAIPRISSSRGYHLPALYAPPGMWSWRSTREQLFKGVDNPEEMKVYVNNCLGLPYEDSTITALDPKDIRNCELKDWPAEADRAPKGCGYITDGVDTHPHHLSVIVHGWGRQGERWILDWYEIRGDSNQESVWLELLIILQREYIHWHSTNRKVTLRIAATCIDTGGHNTAAVYQFCYGREHDNIMPIKGAKERSAPIAGPLVVKHFRIGNVEHKIHLLPVGKLATHGRLFSCLSHSLKKLEKIKAAARNGETIPYEGPGLIHFRPGLGAAFYKELTAPKAKWIRRDGRDQLTYETTPGVDDHVHDCIRYADAARDYLKQDIDLACEQMEKLALERNAA